MMSLAGSRTNCSNLRHHDSGQQRARHYVTLLILSLGGMILAVMAGLERFRSPRVD